ncbi:MAG: type II toxin-antitoxin system RelE/ParE family toxin [Terracidiphilus sp.]|jgi:hypothetical protein
MANGAANRNRFFKTKWFLREARKALISDEELCSAMRQVLLGQAVDLGGGVFKKRLGRNQFRSIILAKGGRNWVYEYIFAKKDRDNISNRELVEFRKLARSYEGLTDQEVDELIVNRDWVEICNGDSA